MEKPTMVAITDEVFQVGGGPLTSPEDAAVYLVSVGGKAALIDAGCGFATGRLLADIRYCGVKPEDIEWLLLTHCHFDHTGGAAGLRELVPGLKTAAHELDAPYIERGDGEVTAAGWYDADMTPCPVDRKLRGPRETIFLGERRIEAIHAPGHTPGSVVFLFESDGKKVLFAQDVHGPLHPSFFSNATDYRKSLEMMLALEADVLCEGHYGVFRGKAEAARFIRQFLSR
jgi:glyoxylase-like metal-dependent hydrolase (beta-lactamase superfamily II)